MNNSGKFIPTEVNGLAFESFRTKADNSDYSCYQVLKASVNISVAQIVQAARDIQTGRKWRRKSAQGETTHKDIRRRRIEVDYRDALRWARYPETGWLSLVNCLDNINCMFCETDRPEIPLQYLSKILIESPETIVRAFPSGTQILREEQYDDLDYLMVVGE